MRKKINIMNIIVTILVLGVYVFNLLRKGREFIIDYPVNMLYIGAGFGIVMLMFSLFKYLRDSVWMDLIYMIYLLLFLGLNIYALILGKFWNLYATFICYSPWVKYVVGFMLFINIVVFVKDLKGGDENE